MVSLFFPCRFNPIAFEIYTCMRLATVLLLFYMFLIAAAAAKAVNCLRVSPSSLLICLGSYFALLVAPSFIIQKKASLSTFKLSKLLTFHRQCHNTHRDNFSHFSVFVIFFFSFFFLRALSFFRSFSLSLMLLVYIFFFHRGSCCSLGKSHKYSLRLVENASQQHKIKESTRASYTR